MELAAVIISAFGTVISLSILLWYISTHRHDVNRDDTQFNQRVTNALERISPWFEETPQSPLSLPGMVQQLSRQMVRHESQMVGWEKKFVEHVDQEETRAVGIDRKLEIYNRRLELINEISRLNQEELQKISIKVTED